MSVAVTTSIATVTSLIIAVILWKIGERRTPIRASARFLLLLALSFAGVFVVAVWRDSTWAVVGLNVAAVGIAFLPSQLIHFFHAYLTSQGVTSFRSSRAVLIGLYVIGVGVTYLAWNGQFLTLSNDPGDGVVFFLKPAAGYFMLGVILVFLLVLISMEGLLRALRGSAGKSLRLLVVGGIVAFIFGIVTASYLFVTERVTAEEMNTIAAAATIAAVLLAISMMRMRMLEDDIVIAREVIYSSVMIFVVGGILIFIGIVAKVLEVVGGDLRAFFSVFAGFALLLLLSVAVTSTSLKERVKGFIDRNVFRGDYDYRDIWNTFSTKIVNNVELPELTRELKRFLSNLLSPRFVTLLLRDEYKGHYCDVESFDEIEPPTVDRIHTCSEVVEWLRRWGRPITSKDLIQHLGDVRINEKMDLSEIQGTVVWVPLIARTDLIGILLLGERTSGRRYRHVDLELLEIIGDQAALAISNRRLDQEILATKELESFYKFSSFVLHDLRNAVSALSIALENSKNHMDNPRFRDELLSTVSRSVRKMSELMGKLSSYDEREFSNPIPIMVDEFVRQVLLESRLDSKESILLKNDLRSKAVVVMDPNHLRRILLNLLYNAAEAMPSGGILHIQTRTKRVDASSNGGHDSDAVVEIEVSDSGVGMSQRFLQEDLFKPFSTTKKKGLGLGLYQCWEIVRSNGGEIDVASEIGKGSTFVVRLPCQDVKLKAKKESAVV